MNETSVMRRLAAILAADVVGYSRMMGEDEAGTLAALRKIWSELFNPAVAGHRGRIVKMMGDGALVEFGSAVDAVQCAIAIQKAMAERNAADAGDKPIAFRIGVNLGDIVIDGDDIFGDGVNVAARLESQAPRRRRAPVGFRPRAGEGQGRSRLRRCRRDRAEEYRAAGARLAMGRGRRRCVKRQSLQRRVRKSRRSRCFPSPT